MSNGKSEFDIMKSIDELLSDVSDEKEKDRIINWIFGKYGKEKEEIVSGNAKYGKKRSVSSEGKSKQKPQRIISDLDLRPNNKKSFIDFINEKKPNNMKEKLTLSVYYLKNILEIDSVNINHIYTCFKGTKDWLLPTNLINMIQQTGSAGLLITNNLDNIEIPTVGENLIEHDLPRAESQLVK
jgi:hypothetical protein